MTLLGIPIDTIGADAFSGAVHLAETAKPLQDAESAEKFAVSVAAGVVAEAIRENFHLTLPDNLLAALATEQLLSRPDSGDMGHLRQAFVASCSADELQAYLDCGSSDLLVREWLEDVITPVSIAMLKADWCAVVKLARELEQSGNAHGVRPATLIVQLREERKAAWNQKQLKAHLERLKSGRPLLRACVTSCNISGDPWNRGPH
jgi:hypothetical protein